MLDLHGRVQGVITLKSLVTDNLGFAVPSNLLKPLLEKPNPVPIKRWMTIGQLSQKAWTTVFGGQYRCWRRPLPRALTLCSRASCEVVIGCDLT